MAFKTLEEIEAAHAAREARKEGGEPNKTPPADEPKESVLDNLDFGPGKAEEPDETQQEIARLKQQLSAMQGRVAPSQQQAAEYRQLYDQERLSRQQERDALKSQIDDLKEQMARRDAELDPTSMLSPEEQDLFDPEQLKVVTKLAAAAAKAKMPRIDVGAETRRILQEQNAKAVEDYRNAVLSDPVKGLSELSLLAQDRDFLQWAGQEDNDDFDPLVRSLLGASSRVEVDRYSKAVAKRIARYHEQRNGKSKARPTDAVTASLENASRRRPSRYSEEDKKAMFLQAKQLARSRNPEDRKRAQALIDKL